MEDHAGDIRTADEISDAERLGRQSARLKDLVAYAKANSELFSELYGNIDPDDFEIGDLPVTEKKSLMARFDDWVTDPEVTLELVTDAESGATILGKYTVVKTSGTTGVPCIVIRDETHMVVHGQMIGQRLVGPHRDLMSPASAKVAAVISDNPRVSSCSSFNRMRASNPEHAGNAVLVPVTEPIEDMIRTLNEFRPDTLTGYPSVLAMLAIRQQDGDLDIDPKIIVCSAECLSEAAFKVMSETWGCPILNNYCTTEGGEVAMTCGLGHLHLNDDWIVLELVDGDDRPVPLGTVSDSVLVTDLSNRVQPFIRYRLEDHAMIHREKCPCGLKRPWMEIYGRDTCDIVLCGRHVPSALLTLYLSNNVGPTSSQFSQTAPDTLEFRGSFERGFDMESYLNELHAGICSILDGIGCQGYRFVISDEPPRVDPRSGKVKQFVNG